MDNDVRTKLIQAGLWNDIDEEALKITEAVDLILMNFTIDDVVRDVLLEIRNEAERVLTT